MELVLYELHPHICLLRELLGELGEEQSTDESDDETYLLNLDPKNWKTQDHYAVLGLKKKRFRATAEEIRKAYRKKILFHHPDKRRRKGEQIKDESHDYYSCITVAYEILGTPSRRHAYDSIDPLVVDDSVPSLQEIKGDFFNVLSDFFARKERWSKRQPVPNFGTPFTDLSEVHKFYAFWEEYDTIRDFSYLDDEDKDRADDRESRRAIERQNRLNRERKRVEEVTAVRQLVHLAKEYDPRILTAIKAAREAKDAKRQARLDAIRQRREAEEERVRRKVEAEAAARAASEERRRIESERLRKEREASRIEAKRERRQLRTMVIDRFNYFMSSKIQSAESGAQQVRVLADMDLLCHCLSNTHLHDLNEQLAQAETLENASELFNSQVEKVKLECQTHHLQTISKSNLTDSGSNLTTLKWTDEMIQALVKGVNILPAGTQKRWEAIAAYVNQHVDGAVVTGKDVLKQAKLLKQNDVDLRKSANVKAFDSFTSSVRETEAVKNVPITTQLEAEGIRPWNLVEQRALEQALKAYPARVTNGRASADDRWQRIADAVGTRTRRECMLRCKELSEQVRAKKAALAAVTKNPNLETSDVVKTSTK